MKPSSVPAALRELADKLPLGNAERAIAKHAEKPQRESRRMIAQHIDHQARQSRLHATDVAAILGLEGARKTGHTVWLEKRGMLENWSGNEATEAGTFLEPSILDYAERELGPLQRNVFCEANGLDFPLAATLDSRVIESGVPAEAKTSGIVGPLFGQWGEAGSDDVPMLYLVQLSVQMLCAEAEFAHLYALLGGRGFVAYRVHRDDDVIREIVERCGAWWNAHITNGLEPTITEPIPMEIIKRIKRQPNKTVELYEDATQAVAEYEAAKATGSAADKTLEAAKSKLIAMLGDAEAGVLPDGRQVTFLQQSRKGYTVSDTTFRTLRIKKA